MTWNDLENDAKILSNFYQKIIIQSIYDELLKAAYLKKKYERKIDYEIYRR